MRRLSSLSSATAIVLAGFAGSSAISPTTPRVQPAAYSSHQSGSHQLIRLDAEAARNKRLATRAAQRLLALAPLPADATPSNRKTVRLGPALGTPATSSLIDQASYWHSDTGFWAVWRYVRTHPPAHLPRAGGESGYSGGPIRGIAWSEPDTRYAQWLVSSVDLRPDGSGGTYLETDGMAEWLDPRPQPAYVGRHPIRVTVAQGCPRTDRGVTGVLNPDQPDLAFRLVPRAAPVGALVCGYGGLNARHRFRLGHQRLLDRSHARSLAARARSLPVAHLDDVVSSCPADFGEVTIIVFAYRSAPDVDLLTGGGCAGTNNGHIWVWGTPL